MHFVSPPFRPTRSPLNPFANHPRRSLFENARPSASGSSSAAAAAAPASQEDVMDVEEPPAAAGGGERNSSASARTGGGVDAGMSIPGYDPSKRDPRFAFAGMLYHVFF